MAQIGDNIVLAQVSASTIPENDGKDILIWNHNDAKPEVVNAIHVGRDMAIPAVISGRFFPECEVQTEQGLPIYSMLALTLG